MTSTQSKIVEWIFSAALIAFLILRMSSLLIVGSATLPHDNFNNYFPAFSFLVDNLYLGQLPLWNPFSHGGEPFYPILLQERLLEPLTFINLFLLKPFLSDYILLHNWNRFLQSLFMLLGMYLVLRRYTTHLLTRLILLLTLFLSSTLLGSFQQEGILHQFLWAPYVVMALQRIFENGDRRWRNFILLGVSIGVNFQSYLFAGVSLLLLFVLVGIAWKHPQLLRKRDKRLWLSFAILLLMSGPNLAVYFERGDYVFPMRMFSADFEKDQIVGGPMQWEGGPNDLKPAMRMDYALASRTGSTSTVWDYVQLVAPGGNPIIHGMKHAWGDPSEAFLYLGVFVWFASLWGLFASSHPSAGVWKVSFVAWGLMTLGVAGGLHRILFPFFPPLWVMRNTHCLVLYFQFATLFFFIQGFESLFIRDVPFKISLQRLPLLGCVGAILFGLLNWAALLDLPHLPRTPIAIAAGTILIVLLKKFACKAEVFICLICVHFAFAFTHTSDRIPLVALWVLALMVPALALVLRNIGVGLKIKGLALATALLILFSIAGDLFHHFYLSRHLYTLQPDPKQYMDVDTHFERPSFPASRLVTEHYPNFVLKTDPPIQQIPRYMSLLLRKPFALSPIFEWKNKVFKEDFQWARESKRWNSFLMLESYFRLIHSARSDNELASAFAIGQPLVQFRDQTSGNQGDLWLPSGRVTEAIIKTTEYTYSYVKIDVTNRTDGFLYYSDGFHRHWKATIDGNDVPVLRANDNFKAVAVPKGTHQIVMKYRPRGFIWGTNVFFCTFGLSILAILFSGLLELGPYLRKLLSEFANSPYHFQETILTPRS